MVSRMLFKLVLFLIFLQQCTGYFNFFLDQLEVRKLMGKLKKFSLFIISKIDLKNYTYYHKFKIQQSNLFNMNIIFFTTCKIIKNKLQLYSLDCFQHFYRIKGLQFICYVAIFFLFFFYFIVFGAIFNFETELYVYWL